MRDCCRVRRHTITPAVSNRKGANPPNSEPKPSTHAKVGSGGQSFQNDETTVVNAGLSSEFLGFNDPVFARSSQHSFAYGDRLQVVPAGDVRFVPRLERTEQPGHGAGERVGEP